MTRVVTLVLLVAGIAGAAVFLSEPDWYLRARYPLRYEHIVRGHAENYDLDPALVAAVIYQESKFKPEARSESGAIGLMQLLPETTRRSTSATAPGTSATCSTSTAPRNAHWPRTTGARGTSIAG